MENRNGGMYLGEVVMDGHSKDEQEEEEKQHTRKWCWG